MHLSFRTLSLVSVSVLLPIVAGCGASVSSKSPSPNSSKTVVIALPVQTAPNWFFPVFSTNTFSAVNIELDALLYKPLFDVTPHDTIDFSHSLISKATWNKTDTAVTLNINPRYQWSNGHPISASDIIFTWNLMKAASGNSSSLPWNYGGAGSGGVPNDFKSVTAINSQTVKVTLNTAVNPQWFLLNGLGQMNPVPASVWDKYPNNIIEELTYIKNIANNPTASVFRVVDGPYMFSQVKPNESWSFVANPHYGGKKSQIKTLIFQYETSSDNEFAALKKGTITVGYLPLSLYKSRQQLANIDTIIPGYVWGMSYLQPNMHHNAPNDIGSLFKKLYIRQALAYGINQPGIIQSFFDGQGISESGPIPSRPVTPYFDQQLKNPVYAFNPHTGKALLIDHGWKEIDGVMTKNGKTLSFTLNYNAGSQTVTDIAELLKSDWAQEGINVKLVSTPFDELIALPNDKWSMIWLGLGSWIYAPDYYPTGGALFKTNAALNGEGYSNSEMNHLINLTYSPYQSTTQEIQRLDQYQEFAAHHIPVIWMPYAANFYVVNKSLHGYKQSMNLVSGLIYPNYWSLQ
ncbi:peptide ABC transporter substrate-binding protein [Sulfobacillus thermosulfidooxidans]|uniref:peptide ABC transporter substrate-binding protein n=1 Tax=Sulfobacillus thermosulfidooxidans TaxID=28034 RepID=UPI001FA7D62D|nr:peptide ABC transporter substrate-binding protein [Sulfobacillus thermosulfidooxidans]